MPSFWRHFEDTSEDKEDGSRKSRTASTNTEMEAGRRTGDCQRFEVAVAFLHASLAAFMPGLQDLAR